MYGRGYYGMSKHSSSKHIQLVPEVNPLSSHKGSDPDADNSQATPLDWAEKKKREKQKSKGQGSKAEWPR